MLGTESQTSAFDGDNLADEISSKRASPTVFIFLYIRFEPLMSISLGPSSSDSNVCIRAVCIKAMALRRQARKFLYALILQRCLQEKPMQPNSRYAATRNHRPSIGDY